MPLTIYRRHAADCQVHALRLPSRIARSYRECDCPLWIYGITEDNQLYQRQSLHTREWSIAEAKVRAIQAAAVDVAVHGPTLADCIRRHLDAHAPHVADHVLRQHALTLERFEDFARRKNTTFMSDLSVDLVEDFKTYALRKFKSTTQALFITKLKFFLREAHRRGWLADPIHIRIRNVRAVYEQKQPYTDDEIHQVLDEAERLTGGNDGYASQPHTFRLLIELMLQTGLRVSDAVRFDPRRCTRGEQMWVYRFEPTKQRRNKQRRTAEVFLSDRLHGAISGAAWLSPRYPFAYRAFDSGPTTLEYTVYITMQGIGTRCGVPDCRPHRLRDTFAVRMLTQGVPIEDVSRLLGHASIAITEKYYAAWTTSRVRRLEGTVRQALVDAVGD
jgi:integrase/recombinase XerD